MIVEPVGSQEKFEAARDDYRETIKRTGACLLLAVFRGKMSEGISFNDDNARGVICVGIVSQVSFVFLFALTRSLLSFITAF